MTVDRLHTSAWAFWSHFAAMKPLDIAVSAGLTAAIIVAAVLVTRVLNWLMCQAISHLPGETQKERNTRAHKALQLTRWVMTLVVFMIAAVLVAGVWNFDVLAWTSEGVGQRIASTVMRVLTVLILATLAIEAVGLFSRRALGRLRKASADPRRAAQLETLGPLVRRVLQMVIIVLALMTLLGQVGVQIAPVLAGAGVLGVAIGFGAQTIVKDVLTGLFLIIEDIVAVGDVVQISNSTGKVEDMTLRTIRLRASDGTLHIFPYGESQVIHNMTKTFSYAAFDIPVHYGTDLDKAMEVMTAVGMDLRDDPAMRDMILDDIEISGVDLLSDVGILIKGRIRTRPLDRWKVLRAYYARLKPAFDAAGIQITHKA